MSHRSLKSIKKTVVQKYVTYKVLNPLSHMPSYFRSLFHFSREQVWI